MRNGEGGESDEDELRHPVSQWRGTKASPERYSNQDWAEGVADRDDDRPRDESAPADDGAVGAVATLRAAGRVSAAGKVGAAGRVGAAGSLRTLDLNTLGEVANTVQGSEVDHEKNQRRGEGRKRRGQH